MYCCYEESICLNSNIYDVKIDVAWKSWSFGIYKLDICNILEVVESHFDSDYERIFFNRTKQTLLNTIDWNNSLATHVILTVHLHLSNAPQLLLFFGNELKSLIKWEVFFFLVIDSPNSLVFIVLIDSGLNSEALVIFVLADLNWF